MRVPLVTAGGRTMAVLGSEEDAQRLVAMYERVTGQRPTITEIPEEPREAKNMTVWVALEYDCFDGCAVAGVFTAEAAAREFVERKEGERNAPGARLMTKDGSPVSGYVYDGPCEVTE